MPSIYQGMIFLMICHFDTMMLIFLLSFTFYELKYLIHKNLSDMTMDDITFPNPSATPAPSNQNQTASPNEVLDVLIDIPF